MTGVRALLTAAGLVATLALGWLLFVGLPMWFGPSAPIAPSSLQSTESPGEDGRKIKARLFYVSDDGIRLTGVEREVPYATPTVAQARRILEAQLTPVDSPLLSAIPPGTTLRGVFLTDAGSAYVDLTHEVSTGHSGGSLSELLTIYTVVQALTTNLPAVTSVQLLVDGKEVDTLAGHVDLKRPLLRADDWVVESAAR